MTQQILTVEEIDQAIAKGDFLTRNQKLELPCKLDLSEIAGVASARAKLERELAQVEQDLVDKKAEFKAKIEELQAKIDTYGADIAREAQDRIVMCDLLVRGNVVITVRRDTNEVVTTRRLEPAEAQKHLPAVEGNSGILDEAARAQKANNSVEDDDGDVQPDDGADELARKRGKRK